MSDRDTFREWFQAAQGEGLADIKFFVKDGDSLSDEQFFGFANDIAARVDAGQQKPAARLANEPQKLSLLFS